MCCGCEYALELAHSVTQITITIPPDFGSIVDMFEVRNGVILNITSMSVLTVRLGTNYYGDEVVSGVVNLNNVEMDNTLSTQRSCLCWPTLTNSAKTFRRSDESP